MALFDFITSLAPLVGQVIGYQQANKAISKYNQPTGAEKRVNALYEAILDPNNGLLNTLSEQERFAANQSFLSQLREMQLADRRAGAMGRANTFFNPERADETISFLTQRGLPMLNAIAAERAQNRITGAATGIGGLIPQQIRRNDIAMQQGVSRGATLAGAGDYFLGGGGRSLYPALGIQSANVPQYDIYNNPMSRPVSTYHNNLGWIDWR